jgi:hypothetical protein
VAADAYLFAAMYIDTRVVLAGFHDAIHFGDVHGRDCCCVHYLRG